jgi:NAD(P)-dependent dehydrogenase (short-subunit alcohol dehydrogenase family)
LPEQNEYTGKSALVTGGTTGIGLGIARGLARAGARVIAAGLGELPAPEPGIAFQNLNVTSQEQVNALAGSIERLDILVNCAGIIRRDDEFEMPVFEQVLDVNLSGTMRMCVACKPLLALSRGSIVNMASMLTFFGGPRVPAYSASKGGVAQLTRSLAVAWAAEGIRVNAVAPGWIRTPLTAALQADSVRSSPILSRTPMGRWGEPEDVAGPVLFLCSRAAAFVTGIVLPVDGGYSVS